MNSLTISLPILKTKEIKNGFLKFFWFLNFSILISIFCFTIIQMSFYAREVFLIKSYKNKITKLTKENKDLEIEFSKSNSLTNLEDYLKNFEKVKNAKYIKLTGASVVEK